MHRKMSSSSIHALMFAAMIGTAAGSLVAQQETAARPAVHGHDPEASASSVYLTSLVRPPRRVQSSRSNPLMACLVRCSLTDA